MSAADSAPVTFTGKANTMGRKIKPTTRPTKRGIALLLIISIVSVSGIIRNCSYTELNLDRIKNGVAEASKYQAGTK